jgi:hypothetical protein
VIHKNGDIANHPDYLSVRILLSARTTAQKIRTAARADDQSSLHALCGAFITLPFSLCQALSHIFHGFFIFQRTGHKQAVVIQPLGILFPECQLIFFF